MNVVAANTPVPDDPRRRRRSKTGSPKIVGASHHQVFTWSDSVGNKVHGLELLGNGVGVRLQIKLGAERSATNSGGGGVQLRT